MASERAPGHTTTWEDDGLVGVECQRNRNAPSFTVSVEDRDGLECPGCGMVIRLVWNVHLVEVRPERAEESGE